jgi:ligand-binding sensor domain-containing protein
VIVTLLAVAAAPRATAIMSSNDAAERAALPFRVFTDADGLPHNTVHAIRLDRSGVLWIATQDGAAAWDGRVWRAVDMPESAHSNFVRAILTHSDGSLWFGTQANGVHRLLDGAWMRVPGYPGGRDYTRVNALLETTDPGGASVVWIGTHDGGVLRWAGGRCEALAEDAGLPARRVWALHAEPAPGGGTEVWVGTESGLARLVPTGDVVALAQAMGEAAAELAAPGWYAPEGGYARYAGRAAAYVDSFAPQHARRRYLHFIRHLVS